MLFTRGPTRKTTPTSGVWFRMPLQAITSLEPWIGEVVDQPLKGIDAAVRFNVIDRLAFPLPIAVICHLLGVPAEDHTKFRVWGHQVATTLDPQSDLGESRTRSAELARTAYLRNLVKERRTDPDDRLLSALIAAEETGDGTVALLDKPEQSGAVSTRSPL